MFIVSYNKMLHCNTTLQHSNVTGSFEEGPNVIEQRSAYFLLNEIIKRSIMNVS